MLPATHRGGRRFLPRGQGQGPPGEVQGKKAGAGLLIRWAALGAPKGSVLWERLCPESEMKELLLYSLQATSSYCQRVTEDTTGVDRQVATQATPSPGSNGF